MNVTEKGKGLGVYYFSLVGVVQGCKVARLVQMDESRGF